MSQFARAVLIVLVTLFLFDLVGVFVKHLVRTYPAEQLSLLRNLFGIIPSALFLLASKKWRAAGRPVIIRQWKLGLGRGLFVTFAQISFYTSLKHLEFATAATIGFSAPLFITALSWPVLGQRVGIWRWAAVFIGFVGIMWVVRPGSAVFSPYALLPIAGAMGYATVTILAQKFDSDVPNPMINLYTAFGAVLGSCIILYLSGRYVPVVSAVDWLWILAMGLSGGLAVVGLVTAYRLTMPSNLAPFEFFGIVYSFILGWAVFGEAPFGRLFPGVLLIVGGGLLIVWRERLRLLPGSRRGQPCASPVLVNGPRTPFVKTRFAKRTGRQSKWCPR